MARRGANGAAGRQTRLMARAQRNREEVLEPLRDVLRQVAEAGGDPHAALESLGRQRGLTAAEAVETAQAAVIAYRDLLARMDAADLRTEEAREDLRALAEAGDPEGTEALRVLEVTDEIGTLVADLEAAGLDLDAAGDDGGEDETLTPETERERHERAVEAIMVNRGWSRNEAEAYLANPALSGEAD
jgi:hypothetical protein